MIVPSVAFGLRPERGRGRRPAAGAWLSAPGPGHDDQIERYVDAIAAELRTLGTPQPVRTLFLGGGTPSHLPTAPLARLLAEARHWLPPESGHEFSVEANPESLDADKVAVLADHGVT